MAKCRYFQARKKGGNSRLYERISAVIFQTGRARRSMRICTEEEAEHFVDKDKPGFGCRFINEYYGECQSIHQFNYFAYFVIILLNGFI